MKFSKYLLLTLVIGCSYNNNSNIYPEQIGLYKLNSVVEGDSAVNEINTLHQLSVAADKNYIARYGENSSDILYISKFSDHKIATVAYDKMHLKMQSNKNSPFSFLVPMKKYENSFMTLGLGSVHYIYQSGEYLLWYSTKQKFYNELPKELLEIYPVILP